MKDRIAPYGKIYVRFLTETERDDKVKISDSVYTYLVSKRCFDVIRDLFVVKNTANNDVRYLASYPVCSIINAKGYNYRGNNVLITNYEVCSSKEADFGEINIHSITFKGTIENPFLVKGVCKEEDYGKDGLALDKLKNHLITKHSDWCIYSVLGEEPNLYNSFSYKDSDTETQKILDVKSDGYDKSYITTTSLSTLAPMPVAAMTALGDSVAKTSCSLESLRESFYTLSQDEDVDFISLWPKNNPYTAYENNDSITINEKENKSMFENVFKGFEFGKAQVRTSIYGPAFRCGDMYVSYDKKTENYVDVTDLLLDIENMNYKMPIAATAVTEGDYILHMHKWVRVLNVLDGERLEVEDMQEKQVITILPVKNVFGFDFYTKLFCFADNLFGEVNAENPFGNLLPLMLMSKDSKNDNLLPLMLMSGGFSGNTQMSPLMMYALMGNKGNDNTLLMLMMMNGGNGFNFPNLAPAVGFEKHPSDFEKAQREAKDE